MGKSLVIVESPAKAKTINKYLGNDYIVKSSIGHIRDLPTSGSSKASPVDAKQRAKAAALTRKMSPEEKEIHKKTKAREQLVGRMGIDPDNDWKARYEILPGKEKVVNELKKLAENADTIYLATDLDREERQLRGIYVSQLVVMIVATNGWSLTRLPRRRFRPRLKNQPNSILIVLMRSRLGAS